ncbi:MULTISPECIES: hypothetical protein [Microbacterium]|uniref:hypothetical protein n=1 Tax=Microbacterium TaxID=33882 RepID=UPI00034E9F0E|nr:MULTISPECIES: hypothetical protein [Microbacterium]EPD84171.1 hypothetical protein HMPREF1529_02211 [Microbacterium sp. oral taxon 186 str. F0373]
MSRNRLFNSRDQMVFSSDPEPFVRLSDGRRGGWDLLSNADECSSVVVWPRRAYIPTPHNPTSRLLADFRALHGAKRGRILTDAALAWRGNVGTAVLNDAYTTEEAVHACRVLTRIAGRHVTAS